MECVEASANIMAIALVSTLAKFAAPGGCLDVERFGGVFAVALTSARADALANDLAYIY